MIPFDEIWSINMSSVCLGNRCGRLPQWQWRRTAFGPKLQLDKCDMKNQPETFLHVTYVTLCDLFVFFHGVSMFFFPVDDSLLVVRFVMAYESFQIANPRHVAA